MKVKELIQKLQEVDPESKVDFLMDIGCCGGDWETLTMYEIVNYYTDKVVVLYFDPIPGYRSCIEAGKTRRNLKD